MTDKELVVLEQVAFDLRQGKLFYDNARQGVGDYFFDSIIADIESLRLYAGIHNRHFGLYRMLAKRFPFAIYYDVFETAIVVIAVLDLRRNPIELRKQLNRITHPIKT
ncbi:MAG: type II toxin-antitoxin system RelE/ParE family toxin [Methylobacter sp.]